jgi:hypothetical protein
MDNQKKAGGLTLEQLKAMEKPKKRGQYVPPAPNALGNIVGDVAKDFFGSAVVKPAIRTGQAVAGAGIGLLGNDQQKQAFQESLKKPVNVPFLGSNITVQPPKTLGKEILSQGGDLLKTASYTYGANAAPAAIRTTLGGAFGSGAKLGTKIGAIGGAMYGAGESVQEDPSLSKTLKETAIQGAIGGIAGGVLGGATSALGKALEPVPNKINRELDNFLSKRTIDKQVKFITEEKNTPVREIISDPFIFKDLKVRKIDGGMRVDATNAIDSVQNRIDIAMDIKKQLLPEYDRIVGPLNKETLRQKTAQEINNSLTTPKKKKAIMKKAMAEIDDLPDEILPSEIDRLRAIFRKEARNAKDIQKEGSHYSALENSFRDTIFEIELPSSLDNAGEIAKLNQYIKDQINTYDFLSGTVDKQIVSGGKLGNMFGQSIGALAGSQGGVFTSILGAKVGGIVSDILTSNQLGSSVKIQMIRNITDNPQVLDEARKFLSVAQNYAPPQLNPAQAGAFRSAVGSGDTINMPPRTPAESQLQRVDFSGQNITPQTSNLLPSGTLPRGFQYPNPDAISIPPRGVVPVGLGNEAQSAGSRTTINPKTKDLYIKDVKTGKTTFVPQLRSSQRTTNTANAAIPISSNIPPQSNIPAKKSSGLINTIKKKIDETPNKQGGFIKLPQGKGEQSGLSAKSSLPKNIKETFIGKVEEGYKPAPLTTKLLRKLEGKSTVSKQFISDLTNSPDLKQVEKDLIRAKLQGKGDKINVADFGKEVEAELLPLKVNKARDMYSTSRGATGGRYENITLPDDLRGNVQNYQENIYESPIKTSAGQVHFGQPKDGVENYFGHTRIEDMADNKTRRVIEVQSDLFQKGNLEREMSGFRGTDKVYLKRKQDLAKLQQYNNPTAHFRMVREEIQKAAKDGKEKLQFPTGETALKIEGLGQGDLWHLGYNQERGGGIRLTPDALKIGEEVVQGSDKWIITDVLEDGKFKAVQKNIYENTD